MSQLGTAIRMLRAARKMSLMTLSQQAGIAKSHLWDLEQGRSDNPSVDVLVALGTALRADPADLFMAATRPDASDR